MDNTAAHHTLDVVPRDAPWRLLSRSAPAPHEDPAAMHDRVSRRTTTFRCHADRVKQVRGWAVHGLYLCHHSFTPSLACTVTCSPSLPPSLPLSLTMTLTLSLTPSQVEVEPMEPHLFWSASEDGTVRQYDLRTPMGRRGAMKGHVRLG